jgi:putative transposase
METPLDIRWSRAFIGDPTTVTITKDPAGRYFVSFLLEEEITPLPVTEAVIGLDMGVSALVTLSTGEKITTPNTSPAAAIGSRRRRSASLAARTAP